MRQLLCKHLSFALNITKEALGTVSYNSLQPTPPSSPHSQLLSLPYHGQLVIRAERNSAEFHPFSASLDPGCYFKFFIGSE